MKKKRRWWKKMKKKRVVGGNASPAGFSIFLFLKVLPLLWSPFPLNYFIFLEEVCSTDIGRRTDVVRTIRAKGRPIEVMKSAL